MFFFVKGKNVCVFFLRENDIKEKKCIEMLGRKKCKFREVFFASYKVEEKKYKKNVKVK